MASTRILPVNGLFWIRKRACMAQVCDAVCSGDQEDHNVLGNHIVDFHGMFLLHRRVHLVF